MYNLPVSATRHTWHLFQKRSYSLSPSSVHSGALAGEVTRGCPGVKLRSPPPRPRRGERASVPLGSLNTGSTRARLTGMASNDAYEVLRFGPSEAKTGEERTRKGRGTSTSWRHRRAGRTGMSARGLDRSSSSGLAFTCIPFHISCCLDKAALFFFFFLLPLVLSGIAVPIGAFREPGPRLKEGPTLLPLCPFVLYFLVWSYINFVFSVVVDDNHWYLLTCLSNLG